jgi:hypothetical protein
MKNLATKKWFYPVVYLLIFLLSMLPLYTEKPYDPRNTQDVILSVLRVSLEPYKSMAPLIRGLFVLLLFTIVLGTQNAGRVLPALMGVDFLLIAVSQNAATTDAYGYAILTGNMLIGMFLGITWLWMAWRSKIEYSVKSIPAWRWLLLPLALLAFWAPYRIEGLGVVPSFDPRLLVTSPDFGMTFCLSTPVYLFILILFYPRSDGFAFRVTAFSGLLYGLLNLTHWFTPGMAWMGFLHLPLQVISVVALLLPWLERRRLKEDEDN